MARIKYIEHNFNASSYEVIDHANDLIADYAAQGLSLTLRQLYYRFVAANKIANVKGSYDRLGGIVSNARLAGLMDWHAIEDRGRELQTNSHWCTPDQIVSDAARWFATDRWAEQEYRVEVWVEKQALEGVVGQAAQPLDCAYFSCKGYTSMSEMWRASERLQRYIDDDQRPVIIHLGDHDPSGIDMTRDIFERLNETFGVEVEVNRIALNMPQIRKHKPPPNPAKVTDSRFAKYAAQYGDDSWEVDALEPATLRELIQGTIRKYLDQDLFDECVEAEVEPRRLLEQASVRWPEIVKLVNKPKPQRKKKTAKKKRSKKQ